MKIHKMTPVFLIMVFLTAVLSLFSGCDQDADDKKDKKQVTIIEQGSGDRQKEEDELTAESELASLCARQAEIASFYFEQTIAYPNGSVFMRVWYKDDKMKLSSSADGVDLTETYYDYAAGTLLDYSPANGNTAWQMPFDPMDSDAPDNPVLEDYTIYTVSGRETVEGKECLRMETPSGDVVWADIATGFPVQSEFTDSLGNRITMQYENVQLNSVTDAQVTPPDDLEINHYNTDSL